MSAPKPPRVVWVAICSKDGAPYAIDKLRGELLLEACDYPFRYVLDEKPRPRAKKGRAGR